jgi:transcriptional regulator with XRE-family HTH domain
MKAQKVVSRYHVQEEAASVRRLAVRRRSLGLSQSEVARQVPELRGRRDSLSRIEGGLNWITARQLVGLARCYGVAAGVIAEEALAAWIAAHPGARQ